MATRTAALTYGNDLTSFKAFAQVGIGAALSAFGWTAQSGNGEVNWSNIVTVQPLSLTSAPPRPTTYRWQGNFVAGTSYTGSSTDNNTNDLVNGSDNNTYMAAQTTALTITSAIRQTAVSFTPSSITSAGASTMVVNCATTIGAGGTNTYLNWAFTLAGMNNGNNNGTWIVTASTATSLTLNNSNGTNETPAGSPTGTASANTTTYIGTITNGASNGTVTQAQGAFTGKTFTTAGWTGGNTGNNQTAMTVLANSATVLAFTNSSGVTATQGTTATSADQPSTSLWNNGTNGGFWYLYPYETWKNSSTTNPVYIKIVYALSNTGGLPQFQISIGNSYGTSGVGTGVVGGNQITWGSNNIQLFGGVNANSKVYECNFSGDSLNFRCTMWSSGDADGAQIPWTLVVDYARDQSGNSLDTWFLVSFCTGSGSASTLIGKQFIYKTGAGGTSTLVTDRIGCWMTDTTGGSAFNGSILAQTVHNFPGYIATPQLGIVVFKLNEVIHRQLVNVFLLGTTHTYLVHRSTGSGNTITNTSDPAPSATSFNANNQGAIAILYE
jgi:hypothetical protein